MNRTPIRAIFVLKEIGLSGPPDPAASEGPREIIAALRARPRAASLAKARHALRGSFSVDLAHDSADGLYDPCPGIRVMHFELTELRAGGDFPAACARALAAMALCPKGERSCAPVPFPDWRGAAGPAGARAQAEAFAAMRRGAILSSCCSLERAGLGLCSQAGAPKVKSCAL